MEEGARADVEQGSRRRGDISVEAEEEGEEEEQRGVAAEVVPMPPSFALCKLRSRVVQVAFSTVT